MNGKFIPILLLVLLFIRVPNVYGNNNIIQASIDQTLLPAVQGVVQARYPDEKLYVNCIQSLSLRSNELHITATARSYQQSLDIFLVFKNSQLSQVKIIPATEHTAEACHSKAISMDNVEPQYEEMTKEQALEKAMLMLLHQEIYTALQNHYQQQFIQYDAEKILSVQQFSLPYGGRAFEIVVQLRKKNENQDDIVTITLRSDQEKLGQFKVTQLEIQP